APISLIFSFSSSSWGTKSANTSIPPYLPQHFLYFFPLPQGQGSFLPIFLTLMGVWAWSCCAAIAITPVLPPAARLVESLATSRLLLRGSWGIKVTRKRYLVTSSPIPAIISLNI